MKVNFEQLAINLMFGRKINPNLQYRKGKSIEDVHKAFTKAMKNGMGKTEYELSMLEIYLQDVFKKSYKGD